MRVRQAPLTVRVALTLFAAMVIAACETSTQGAATPKSYTGALIFASFSPFTGLDANFGPEMQAGCIVAAHLINKAGGVLGHQVKCIGVDTRGDPAYAMSAEQQMITGNPNLVGMNGPSSDEALATVPLIDQAHIPMFGDTGQDEFDKSNFQYFWRLTPPDDAAGIAMAVYAYRKGYRRGAAMFGNDPTSQGNVPNLLSAFQKLGGQIVTNQQLQLDQSSYRSEVETMIAANPDVMFTEADPQIDAAVLSQYQQIKGTLIPVVGTQPTVQPLWAQAVSGAIGVHNLAQIFAGAQPYTPSQGPAWDAFNTELLASGADIPQPDQWSQDSYTESDYDAIVIMALAMIMAGTPDPSFYNAYISQVVAPGGTEVHSFAEGMAALKAGKKITYVGAGGGISLDKYHNSAGAFEIVGYAPDGTNPQLDVVSAADIARLTGG